MPLLYRNIALAFLFPILFIVNGCSSTGDFGRYEPSGFEKHVIPPIRNTVNALKGIPASGYPMTNNEEDIRVLSKSITQYEVSALTGIMEASGVNMTARNYKREKHKYVEYSTGTMEYDGRRSVHTPQELASEMEDLTRKTRNFETVAMRVYADDHIRQKQLLQSSHIPADDLRNVTGRIKENRAIVKHTILALVNMGNEYEIEIDRSLIAYPKVDEDILLSRLFTFKKAVNSLHQNIRNLTMQRRDNGIGNNYIENGLENNYNSQPSNIDKNTTEVVSDKPVELHSSY